jgi:hypothetical protein
MRRSNLLLIALLAFLTGRAAMADSRSATMNVSATVLSRTLLTVNAAPAEVVVTPEDARRGFVVLPNALAFQVRSNNLAGYALRFESSDERFARVAVSWDSTEVVVGRGEAQIAEPYRKGITPFSASVRIDLTPGTQPGRYPFPVRLTADAF